VYLLRVGDDGFTGMQAGNDFNPVAESFGGSNMAHRLPAFR
jgi:hypothetical protein